MYTTKKTRNCHNFRAVEQSIPASFRRNNDCNCKNCAYFSSRNCGMDVADSIEPIIDLLS